MGRYAGLTGSPDESGSKRREKGLSCVTGNGRVRKSGADPVVWRHVDRSSGSDLVQWYEMSAPPMPRVRANPSVVALARKLIIALWRYVETGVVPQGIKLHASAEAVAI